MMPVRFHEQTVILVGGDNEPVFAKRTVVNNLEVDWPIPHVKLSKKISSTVRKIPTSGEDG